MRTVFVTIALSMAIHAGPSRADAYWSYSYRGIDVTASGDAAYARALAHNVHRLDLTARKLLDSDSGAALPPTHIFALHHATYEKLIPKEEFSSLYRMSTRVVSAFLIHGGENYAFMDASDSRPYYGAYFGLAGSILASQGIRYPRWYATGFARLLAPTQIRDADVTVGKVDEWMAKVVRAWRLKFIPVRTLLTAKEDDPILESDLMSEKYNAECWLLVHLITIEGLHKTEFTQYLRRVSDGADPAAAFAANFQVSFEDLDQMLRNVLDKATIRTLSFKVPDEPDTDAPRLLTTAEANAKLATLAALFAPHRGE